jgi:hypothetical protein
MVYLHIFRIIHASISLLQLFLQVSLVFQLFTTTSFLLHLLTIFSNTQESCVSLYYREVTFSLLKSITPYIMLHPLSIVVQTTCEQTFVAVLAHVHFVSFVLARRM